MIKKHIYNGEWEDISGEIVYCITDKLKHFQKNNIYKIERGTSGKTERSYYKIKIKGIKGFISFFPNFDFIENNTALYREFRINEILDIP